MSLETLDLREIDREFAAFICRQAGSTDRQLERAAALLSRGVTAGDVCLDLDHALKAGDAADCGIKSAAAWAKQLESFPVVGAPGKFTPLVLDGANRLYLHRYWRYQEELAQSILARGAQARFDRELLQRGVARLFPAGGAETDWQRVAAIAAVSRHFCVISGGPGTGKTSTVVKVLALLLEQLGAEGCRIALAAPTGKAAARLKESLLGGVACDDEVKALIPDEVSTLHRLLGYVKGSSSFRHNRHNPLPYDVVIVDEASMVSLPLMAKLFSALRHDTRLILLGDRDQLASVEAGAVLGDICNTGSAYGFSAEFASLVASVCGDRLEVRPGGQCKLADAVVLLQRSYRFAAGSGIGTAGAEVNSGSGRRALEICRDPRYPDCTLAPIPQPDALGDALHERIVSGFGSYLRADSPAEALAAFGGYRILCALRSGPYGVEALNVLVAECLAKAGLIRPEGRWYAGQPIMITENDYNLGLFNGDIGLILADTEHDGQLRAFFPTGQGTTRKVLPLRLPAHESAFAMTVHKSQGSEFDRVLLVLPDRDAPLLTRELIYTAITRAKKAVEIMGAEELFLTAVQRRIERRSGLRERLWGEEVTRKPAAKTTGRTGKGAKTNSEQLSLF